MWLLLLLSASHLAAQKEARPVEGHLVYDTHKLSGPLPAHFRTMHDSWLFKCRTGLEKLRASGSGQYTANQLRTIMRILPDASITIIDLRQECHGFADGEPISWIAERNLINYGMPTDWIVTDEQTRLQRLSQTTTEIIAYTASAQVKEGITTGLPAHWHAVQKASTESEIAAQLGLKYIRFTVPDKMLPTDTDVDRFITIIDALHPAEWLHIHCRAGRGRTTTFLALYDMLINASDVSYEDIIKRQYRLGGVNFNEQPERLTLLKSFYAYAQARAGGFSESWRDWRATKNREQCACQNLKSIDR